MFHTIELGGMTTVSTKSACNHVYLVDVSGSMYSDLPKIRQNLKNIISVVAQEQDTFTVLYFSGVGQCGLVFENVLVSDLSSIQMMHDAIDRFIKPIGLTGFIDPIKKAMVLDLDKSKVNNFIMMTDGFDNTSNRTTILDVARELPQKYQNITFIEFGYYADRELISKMAEAVNGTHIFAKGIIDYQAVIEDVVTNVIRVQNIEVQVNKKAKHCIFMYGDDIRIVNVVDGVATIPEDVEQVHSIVPKDVLSKQLSEDHLYMILYYAAKTVNPKLVWDCLQALGDVHLVRSYENAFTKQELSDFETLVHTAVLDKNARYAAGKDVNAVPNKNAKTILDLLAILADGECEIMTDSPRWDYNRTTKGSSTESVLPRFIPSAKGFIKLNNLVYNQSRPNISISTNLKGVVELPDNEFKLKNVQSFITRNYTIIKDGIRNVKELPVVISKAVLALVEEFEFDLIEEYDDSVYVVFKLENIPVINRRMVEAVDKTEFINQILALEVKKAALKVVGHMQKVVGTSSKISGMIDKYGEGAAKYLSELGIRDYGFSPVGTTAFESVDEYESVQLSYKIKGLSSLPKIDDVQKKLDGNKKLNVADTLISGFMQAYSTLSTEKDIDEAKTNLTSEKRDIERELAEKVYTMILGRVWFGEEDMIVEDVVIAGVDTTITLEKVRKMIKI